MTVLEVALFIAWNINLQTYIFHAHCNLKLSSWIVSLKICETIELCFCFHLATICFAAEMKYDVKIFFIFFFVNNVAIPTFGSSKCGSHQQFTLCIWWTVVLKLHSLNGRNKKTLVRGCLQCCQVWNEKFFFFLNQLEHKNKSGLNMPYNPKPPGVVCAQKELLDWGWVSVETTDTVLWRPDSDSSQTKTHFIQI